MKHYLGPRLGRLELDTWEQVIEAAAGGLLEETQWCELKQMLPPSNSRTNVELAKDLASLSVHGGVLIIGVADKTYTVSGCDVAGMRDRISQVAATRIHPPLSPVIHPDVHHPDDESKVVLVVEVPPSPGAPHMVDDKYWGRSANGKRALADGEVRDLISSRYRTSESFHEQLTRFVDSDPAGRLVDGDSVPPGVICLLAEPCAPILGRDANFSLVSALRDLGGTGPLGALSYPAADPFGQALSVAPKRVPIEKASAVGHLLVRDDDGTIEAVLTGATWGEPDGLAINSSGVASAAFDFYRILEKLSLTCWGYSGQWRVGIHVSGLKGAMVKPSSWGRPDTRYARDSYLRIELVTPSTWSEVESEARKLLFGFLRAVGKDDWNLYEVIRDQRE